MARGEPAPRGERGPGLAIWASFAVVCLGALFFTLWSMRACETGIAPPITGSPQPFPGAEAALVPLGTRGCLDTGGPALGGGPGPTTPARATEWLVDRGYVAAGDRWDGPLTLPVDAAPPALAGACGVVAFVATGHITTYTPARGTPIAPCVGDAAIVPACDRDSVRVEGSGTVQQRAFLVPGLTPEMVAESGMPLGALLGHAEAEAHLRAVGWQPADDVVRVSVAPGHTTMLDPPSEPASGCIGWVATSSDLGYASTQWMGRQVDYDGAPFDLTIGLLSCRADPSSAPTETALSLHAATHGGNLFFRPYAPAAGPVVGGAGSARRAIGLGSMRVVAAAPSTLPRAVEMTAPEE